MAKALRPRSDPQETRARIMEVAEEQFRRIGYAKATVADIAGDLGMSPANVYRFFPSKAAIVEAICERCMREHEEIAWASARLKISAAERLERMTIDVFRHTRKHLVDERRMHDMIAVAFDESWEAIQGHVQRTRFIVETVIRDGIASGEFETEDPEVAAHCFKKAIMSFWHPQIVAQCSRFSEQDQEAHARELVRFLIRAMRPNPSD